tara:strand:- start:158 stop:469 length:312 start_codon:yes stop_codon:yes gene_type:complete
MKKIKTTLIILLSLFFLSGCNSVKKGLAGSKNKGSDEFLVKKKSALVLPPNFTILPKPDKVKTIENEEIDLKKIINQENDSQKKKITQKLDTSLEEFVLEKIK